MAAAAKFTTGSPLRHVVVMTTTGSIGLMAVFAVDLANLFYISILPTVVDINTLSAFDVPILLAITAIILTAVQFPFAVVGAGTRRTLQSPRATRLFNRGAAVCMGGAAATIALRN